MKPPENGDNLIHRFFGDDVTPELLDEMERWLREDPANVRTLAEYGLLEELLITLQREFDASAVLAVLLELEEQAGPLELYEVPTPTLGERMLGSQQKALLKWFGVAAVLIAGVTFGLWLTYTGLGGKVRSHTVAEHVAPPSQPVQHLGVARITAERNAEWSDAALAVGAALHEGQHLTLTHGLAEITTARGARLILDAPCTVEFQSNDNALRLLSGKLFATVPDHATGFSVDTPDARIIDVGTEFGVEAGDDQTTRLQVYRGEVRAAAVTPDGHTGEFISLYTEEAAAIDSKAGLRQTTFDPGMYERDIATAELRPEPLQGTIWWRGDVSALQSRERVHSEALQVFIEHKGILLEKDIPVDLSWPGRTLPNDNGNERNELPIAAPRRVDVYLLHYDPDRGHNQVGEFRVRFGRPVLGVICRSEALSSVDETLRSTATLYPNDIEADKGSRGLDLNYGDSVSIHPDRISVALKLTAATYYDQLLVIVAAENESEE